MESALPSILALSAAMLAGGVVGSFGTNMLIRSSRGRALVGAWPWWGVALYYLVVAAIVIGGFGWVFTSALADRENAAALQSPWTFLAFGFVVGLPFTLLAVTTVWRQQNKPPTSRKDAGRPRTKRERLDYAQDLERQLKDYAGESSEYRVQLREDKGRVMYISGGLTRDQAERLVTALRAEMADLGFQRVEGRADSDTWWVRV